MKSTNKKTVRAAIIQALEENKIEEAKELMMIWDSQIESGTPATLDYFYTKLRVYLKCYKEAKKINARIQYLHDAIEVGNTFFIMNELQGFPMDEEVREMWYTLVDLSAEFYASYLEEGYEGDLNEDDEESEYRRPDLLIGALQAAIGEINRPNFKE